MELSSLTKIFCPSNSSLEGFLDNNKLLPKPFDKELIEFINDFSKLLLKNSEAKRFPDLISLAFWMRKQQIKKLEELFIKQNINKVKVARGLVFHIAPSNVDTIFIYSLFLSMMLGNKNIIRISSKRSERQDILLNILNDLFKGKHSHLKDILRIINYDHNKEITDKLSSFADARIIWGGDDTINEISKSISKPTCIDLKFSNKYSYAILDADELANIKDDVRKTLIKNFVNDAYWFGQQACSSPKTVIWLNAQKNIEIINEFWKSIELEVYKFEHNLEIADFINKYVAQQQAAIISGITIKTSHSNLLNRIQINNNSKEIKSLNCGSGLFYELHLNSLDDLAGLFKENDQTLSYFGVNIIKLKNIIATSSYGIDRVVPIGAALNFSHVWDGYDFFEQLTRQITFE